MNFCCDIILHFSYTFLYILIGGTLDKHIPGARMLHVYGIRISSQVCPPIILVFALLPHPPIRIHNKKRVPLRPLQQATGLIMFLEEMEQK